MAAQKVFDDQLKAKGNHEEKIYNLTQEMEGLWKEAEVAQKKYDAQDPAERNKSFSVAY